jgi:hypothetical protein
MPVAYTNQLLYTYLKLFSVAGCRTYIKSGSNWFPHSEVSLDFKKLQNHLLEKDILGRMLPNRYTNFFALDFDFKPEEYSSVEEFNSFVTYCCSLVQAPRLYVRSSSSAGVHAYFFIKSTPSDLLQERLSDFFRNKGIIERTGKFEIYCRSKNLRYPLGCGSFLLDEKFNRLTSTKVDDLNCLNDFLKDL